MSRLRGKVALVTGAASGIGRATATRFAEEGASVMFADLDGDGAAEAARGPNAAWVRMDVTDDASVSSALRETLDRLGGLDVLVNNAGILVSGPVETLALAEWQRCLDVNLTSVVRVSQHAWPHLRASGGGAILNTSSVAGIRAIPGDDPYCVTKAGVIMLTRCMALSGAPDAIRVNCVCPGYVDTPLSSAWMDAQPDPAGERALAAALHPLGRLGDPVEVADAFVYLASDEARWVTGSQLVIDGGLTSGLVSIGP